MFRIQIFMLLAFFLTSCMGSTESSRPTYRSSDPFLNSKRMMPVAGKTALETVDTNFTPSSQQFVAAQGKVALLLPLTGQHKDIGQAMWNAAQMAVFDMRDPAFEIVPFDTKGTAVGASQAVRKAASQNVKLILGPLLADNVQAAGATARQFNLQLVGFTTDSTKIGGNVMTLGILPYDQGKRMADYARKSGLKRVVIINPQNQYSNAVVNAFRQRAALQRLQIIETIPYQSSSMIPHIVQNLAQKRTQFDAVFMPVGGAMLQPLTDALTRNSMGADTLPWLGVGLWDDPYIQSNDQMKNAVYAAPSEQQRADFEKRYKSIYNATAPRLASLAYDATALSVILLRQNAEQISRMTLMNPNGFAGIDGIFRFQSNGLAERGLAVHKINGLGRTTIIDAAPTSFTMGAR